MLKKAAGSQKTTLIIGIKTKPKLGAQRLIFGRKKELT